MNYNTSFNVKYFDIEQELLGTSNGSDDAYTQDDVELVCCKLYQDEIMSVFGMETFDADKMDMHLNALYDVFETNESFMLMLRDVDNGKGQIRLLFCLLFSQEVFHIMHKCVCEQLNKHVIDDVLLQSLKDSLLKAIDMHIFTG